MRFAVAEAMFVSAAVLAAPARAQDDPEPIRIRWDAPAACPGVDALRAKIHELLGGPPPADSPKRVVAAGAVSRGPDDRWQLTLVTESDGVPGERTLSAASCEGLTEAAALIIALAFDPAAVAAASERLPPLAPAPPPPPPPPAPAAPLPEPPPRVPPAPPPRPWAPPAARDPLRVLLRLHAGADIGSLPAPAAGLGGAAGLDAPVAGRWHIRVELGGSFFVPQRASLGDRALGGDFDFFALALSAGPALALDGFVVALAAGVELGRMHAEGFGVDHPAERAVLWAGLPVALIGVWRFADPLGLRLDAGALIPFTRPRWLLEDIGDVDRPGPVAARLFAGLELGL